MSLPFSGVEMTVASVIVLCLLALCTRTTESPYAIVFGKVVRREPLVGVERAFAVLTVTMIALLICGLIKYCVYKA